jgi:hypothetical protein
MRKAWLPSKVSVGRLIGSVTPPIDFTSNWIFEQPVKESWVFFTLTHRLMRVSIIGLALWVRNPFNKTTLEKQDSPRLSLPMLIGYARVSTLDQNLHLQIDALQQAGCEKIFEDKISGSKADRPGLKEALDYARQGDCLLVWRLDRLGRSLKDLIEIVNRLEDRGVGFRSLQEAINTTTTSGKLVFQIFGALAEFERNLIRCQERW